LWSFKNLSKMSWKQKRAGIVTGAYASASWSPLSNEVTE
jgi:hypothetical protein